MDESKYYGKVHVRQNCIKTCVEETNLNPTFLDDLSTEVVQKSSLDSSGEEDTHVGGGE